MNKRFEPTGIVARLVEAEHRMNFLPTVFGPRFMLCGETRVYSWMRTLCKTYKEGGYWSYYELNNGGFYMAPRTERKMVLSVTSNGFEGEVSADAAGIIVMLFVLDQMAKEQHGSHLGGVLADRYHHLRNFAKNHVEVVAIFRAID